MYFSQGRMRNTVKRFQDKVVIVTGASAGIGKETALAFAEEGARVSISARRIAEGEEVAQAIRDRGGEAIFTQTDIVDAVQVEHMVRRTVETWGHLDHAFNNAGIEGPVKLTHDYSLEEWRNVIDPNLKGVWLSMKYEIPEMLKGKNGSIVNMSSVLGLVGTTNHAPYVAAKHGVAGLTKAAALEYAKTGIRVNAVNPAGVRTPMFDRGISRGTATEESYDDLHPVGRISDPEEIASAVLWLCSDESSYVNGHALALDGAWTAR